MFAIVITDELEFPQIGRCNRSSATCSAPEAKQSKPPCSGPLCSPFVSRKFKPKSKRNWIGWSAGVDCHLSMIFPIFRTPRLSFWKSCDALLPSRWVQLTAHRGMSRSGANPPIIFADALRMFVYVSTFVAQNHTTQRPHCAQGDSSDSTNPRRPHGSGLVEGSGGVQSGEIPQRWRSGGQAGILHSVRRRTPDVPGRRSGPRWALPFLLFAVARLQPSSARRCRTSWPSWTGRSHSIARKFQGKQTQFRLLTGLLHSLSRHRDFDGRILRFSFQVCAVPRQIEVLSLETEAAIGG